MARQGTRLWLAAALVATTSLGLAAGVSGHSAHRSGTASRGLSAAFHLTIALNPGVPVAAGQPVYLTASATDGWGRSIAPQKVAWTTSAGAALVGGVDATVQFTAKKPGTYWVRAFAGKAAARVAVEVHGQPTAVILSPAALTAPGSGDSSPTVNVAVVDGRGIVDGSFFGRVTLTDTAGQLCAYGGPNSQTIDLIEGKGQFQICPAGKGQPSHDTLTATNLQAGIEAYAPTQPVPRVRYGHALVDNVPSVVASLGLQIQQGDPPYLSANRTTSAQFLVVTRDQAGNLWGQAPGKVTVRLAGPGSFSSSAASSQIVLTTPSRGDAFAVYSVRGHGGPVTITVSAPGVKSYRYTIDSYLNTSPAGLRIAATGQGMSREGMPYTLFTVNLVDTLGQPLALASDRITVTDNAGQEATSDPEAGMFGGNHASLLYDAVLPDSLPISFSSQFMPPPAPFLYMQDGQAQFAVVTGAAGSGPVTVSVRDALHGYRARATYVWRTGEPAGVWLTPNAWFASPLSPELTETACPGPAQGAVRCIYDVMPGQAAPYLAQLVDADGNPLSIAGYAIQLVVESQQAAVRLDDGSWYQTLFTGASGAVAGHATVPAAVRPGAAGEFASHAYVMYAAYVSQVTAPTQLSPQVGPEVNVVGKSAYATRVSLGGVPNGTVKVGDDVQIHVAVQSATGQPLTSSPAGGTQFTNDVLEVASSNPAVAGLFQFSTDTYVGSEFVPPSASGGGALTWAMPDIRAMAPGHAVITVTDVSNPTRASARFTVAVGP